VENMANKTKVQKEPNADVALNDDFEKLKKRRVEGLPTLGISLDCCIELLGPFVTETKSEWENFDRIAYNRVNPLAMILIDYHKTNKEVHCISVSIIIRNTVSQEQFNCLYSPLGIFQDDMDTVKKAVALLDSMNRELIEYRKADPIGRLVEKKYFMETIIFETSSYPMEAMGGTMTTVSIEAG
jgi:hypothetical protein